MIKFFSTVSMRVNFSEKRASNETQCGGVRECTIVAGEDTDSALVEFQSAESVPAALDMDHKKLDSSDIRVTMLWRSTLFVTNFSKDTDDAGIRKLFSQVGLRRRFRETESDYGSMGLFCRRAGRV